MKYYGYTRTSTKTQKLDRGVIEIEEFGRKRKIKIERIFTDQICGKVFERKGYNTLLKLLERGDCVIIPEMDRLGRSKTAIGEELYTFKSREIRLMILELPTTLIDMSNYNNYVAQLMVEAIQNMLLELYAAVAEIEWEKNKKRQREGIEAMKLVEKSNMIKFLIHLLTSLLRLLCVLAVFCLAVCGLLALVYPEPRTALIQVFSSILKQLFSMLSSH